MTPDKEDAIRKEWDAYLDKYIIVLPQHLKDDPLIGDEAWHLVECGKAVWDDSIE